MNVYVSCLEYYIYIRGAYDKFPDFFSYGQLKHETLVPFEVISSSSNALAVPSQQLLEGPMEVFLCEHVNDLRHSLFHLNLSLRFYLRKGSHSFPWQWRAAFVIVGLLILSYRSDCWQAGVWHGLGGRGPLWNLFGNLSWTAKISLLDFFI